MLRKEGKKAYIRALANNPRNFQRNSPYFHSMSSMYPYIENTVDLVEQLFIGDVADRSQHWTVVYDGRLISVSILYVAVNCVVAHVHLSTHKPAPHHSINYSINQSFNISFSKY